MATATKQDDDLLIITDDESSSPGSDDITFSFDIAGDEEVKENKVELSGEDSTIMSAEGEKTTSIGEVESEVVSIETPTITLKTPEEKNEVVTEAVKVQEDIQDTKEDSDISFSLDLDTSIKDDTQPTEASPDEIDAPSEDFSLGLDMSDDTSGNVSNQEVAQNNDSQSALQPEKSDESLNDILAGTIAKLEARKESIASDKATKTSKEEEIKAQIKEFEEEYSKLEAEMKALDAESEKITANIAELEKMKLDPVKQHNAKRVVKK